MSFTLCSVTVRIVEGVWNYVNLCRELEHRVSWSSKFHLGAGKKEKEIRDRRNKSRVYNYNNNTVESHHK